MSARAVNAIASVTVWELKPVNRKTRR